MVNIDRVYQKVLALANKEQRGYITPQEFNLFADHAQMEIFEQYFYDINQWTKQGGNQHSYSDMLTNLQEKIDLFNTFKAVDIVNDVGEVDMLDVEDLYRLGMVNIHYSGENESVTAEYQTWDESMKYGNSKLTAWSKKMPVYSRRLITGGVKIIKIRPFPAPHTVVATVKTYTDIVQLFYTKKPSKPNWAYIVVNDKPLYNATSAVNFELHESEETELVYRILALAGIAIEKPQLTQIAAGLQGAQIQQEKQ